MTYFRKRLAVLAASGLLLVLVGAPQALAQQVTRANSDGSVLALGSNLQPLPTSTAVTCTMSNALAQSVATAVPIANGGGVNITNFDAASCNGTANVVSIAITPTPGPTRPTLALNANAGTGASIAFVAGSTLTAGGISWTAGPSPAAGTQFVVTFPDAFPAVPAAPCVAANRPAAHINLYSIPTTTTVTVGSDVAPTNGTTYVCQYAVVLP